MKKTTLIRTAFLFLVFLYTICISCKSKPVPLSDQLKANFLTHLQKIDSTLVLDSFRILRIDTANERLFSWGEDTLYKIVLARVRSQMANATINKKTDSMAFYQYELDYMERRSDTLTQAISQSDTIRKYGILAICQVQVSKGELKKTDKVYYFLDLNGTIRNGERIDSSISQISRTMH